MQIIVSDTWLEATGQLALSGVRLDATLDQPSSYSRMGNCYDVTLPDGRSWTVFECRGVEVFG